MANNEQLSVDESQIEVRQTHGFKHNIRLKPMDSLYQWDIIDKLKIPFSTTISRSIVMILIAGALVLIGIIYLFNNGEQFKYIGPWAILIIITLIGMASFYALVNPSYGSLLKAAYELFGSIVKRYNVKSGRMGTPRRTGFHRVRDDGVIEFTDGSVGRLMDIDGSTSATAYPSEIRRQDRVAVSYHNGRIKTTYEVNITSSQKQNTARQIRNVENLMKKNTNPAVESLLQLDHYYLSHLINGVKPTIVQHKLMVDKSERTLDESVSRLRNFVGRGFYYSMTELDKEETEKILGDILSLK